mgnify:CR=1 FL=1
MFNSRQWLDLHGDQGMDPEPIDGYADLCRRHALMARRIFTVAEPMLGRPELAEVQAWLMEHRRLFRVWSLDAINSAHPLCPSHEQDIRIRDDHRHWVRQYRAERHRLAARLAREAVQR